MSHQKISLKGLNKADVLAALYNASKPQGMGFIQYDPTPMSREEAQQLLGQSTYFDYLKGRVMKIDLSGDVLDPWGYDRDNGQEAAAQAIAALRSSGNVNPASSQAVHYVETLTAAEEVKKSLHKKSSIERGKHAVTLDLGFDDVADVLGPAVDEAVKKQRQ